MQSAIEKLESGYSVEDVRKF